MSENIKIVSQDKNKEKAKIVIKNVLTIDNTESVRKKILTGLHKYKSIDVQLDNITSLDLGGLQLIIGLKNYCNSNQVDFSIQYGISDELNQLMENCGLTTIMSE
jgi:anti-anti-sigma regulatory factor